jgi:hypothetical protein
MLNGRMFYFANSATIKELLEGNLKEISVPAKLYRKGTRGIKVRKNYCPLNLNGLFPQVVIYYFFVKDYAF